MSNEFEKIKYNLNEIKREIAKVKHSIPKQNSVPILKKSSIANLKVSDISRNTFLIVEEESGEAYLAVNINGKIKKVKIE